MNFCGLRFEDSVPDHSKELTDKDVHCVLSDLKT